MMSKEFLKKLGIFGVSFGLITSPLAFADFHEEEEEGVPQEETAPDTGGNAEAEAGAGVDSTTEYENEEEEYEEEEEWEEEGDDEEQGW